MKTNENSLKLTGNKIELTTRPAETYSTASARCALLGRNLSRPVSAVPLLNLNYSEFEMPISARRPLSADFPTKSSQKHYRFPYTDGDTSVESSEVETESVLRSTQLLKDLLSEPLWTWKNGVRSKTSRKSKHFKKTSPRCKPALNSDTPSAESDTSSSNESERKNKPVLSVCLPSPNEPSPKAAPQQSPKEDFPEEKKEEPQPSPNSMALLPGLKTKPPLPKKDSARRRPNSANLDGMLTYKLGDEELVKSDKESRNNESKEQTSTSTLESESDAIELRFQNWFNEEQQVGKEILVSEWNTNASLQKLKEHNRGVSEPITARDSSRSRKAVNFLSDEEARIASRKKRGKDFIKQNIKAASARREENKSESPKKIVPFVPVAMRTFPEYKPKDARDVESWMSSNGDVLSDTSTEDSKKKSPFPECLSDTSVEEKKKSSPFQECLIEIDELQKGCGENVCDERFDGTDQSDTTTLDDIFSILQVLEEQDRRSQMNMESMKEIVSNELSDDRENHSGACNVTPEHITGKEDYGKVKPQSFGYVKPNQDAYTDEDSLNVRNCSSELDLPQHQLSRSFGSSAHLNNIFSYLDEVNRSSERPSNIKENLLPCPVGDIIKLDTMPRLEELATYSSTDLAHYVIDLTLRLKDKSSSIALLQKELSTLRNEVTKLTKESTDIIKQKLKDQKDEYENVVKRHQKFIDQLICDKKTLNRQCEGLIHEMKVLEDRYDSNLKAAEHKHKIEVQKIKEMHIAGEKIRRDRWIDSKTQKIKELTVKSLEPELEKMSSRHQQELADQRSLHKREIEDIELRAARKMQQQCEAIREQMTEEREKAIAHEREVLRQRYEQLVESEERNYQEQRRRLLAEHAHRLSECEERENTALVEKDRVIKQAQNEYEDKLQAIIRRHASEVNVLKEKTELEMEAFRNNYKKQMAVQLAEKEAQIRDRCRKERDKEIEAVIERLEAESTEAKSQIEQTTENRIRRLREKYEKEIQDLERSEKDTTSKYSETKVKLLETEDLIINLKTNIKHMESQLQESKEVAERLSKERDQVKEIVKEEIKHDMEALEKELHEVRESKEKELHQVYSRVKMTVARKDETISELSRDQAALQEKCMYLENMLEQQRKEYLIK